MRQRSGVSEPFKAEFGNTANRQGLERYRSGDPSERARYASLWVQTRTEQT